ncbi:unnamed protein product [Closterium sp. NIES-54]
MATPSVLTFDAEGRAVDFEVWLDDLQLFLQCDRADGLSLFDLTSGASPAPPATADSTVRSQWATRDAAARLAVRRHLPTTERAHFSQYKSAQTLYDAVVARYSSPATAALSRLFLPYLFPDLAAFPTVADLITHLRTSDTRYRAALPAELCAKNPPPIYLTLYYVVTRLPDSLRVVRDHFLSEPLVVTLAPLSLRGVPPPPSCPLLLLLLRPTSVVSSRSVLRVPLAGAAAVAGARGAGALVGVAGAVEVVVEAVEGVGVVVGVVVEVEVSAAAVEAAAMVAVVEGTAAALVAEAEEVAEAAEAVAELVAALLRGVAQHQQQQRSRETPSPQQLREWFAGRQRGGGTGPCTYVLRTGDRAGERCGGLHSTQRCFGRLTGSWRHQFPDATKIPRWGDLSRAGVAIFDLDYDAILAAMYALSTSDEGDCYLCVPPDPGIEAAALGAGETAALGASASAAPGTGPRHGGGGTEPGGAEPGGTEPGGAGSARVASRGASSRREFLSQQELREWFARRWSRAAGAGGTTAAAGSWGTCPGGAGAAGPGGAAEAAGVGPAGGSAGASGGTGAAGSAGTRAAGATGADATGGAGGSAGAGASEGARVGAAGAGGGAGAGAAAGSPGAVSAGPGGTTRPRPYFVPLLEQVLGLPPSPGPPPPYVCPRPVQSQSQLLPVSPLPAPSPYTGPTGGLAERRAPASRPASPARAASTSRRTSRPRPTAVPGTHQMTLRPSTAPLRVPLPSPPASSLPVLADPASDSLRAASPTVARLLAAVVTDPSLESTAASALVTELVDFAARCRLDYAASLVAESESVCPPSLGGECALSTDVLEDRQEEFQCFAAAFPHLVLCGDFVIHPELALLYLTGLVFLLEEPSARHNLQGYTKQNKAAAGKSSDNQCNSGRYSCSNPAAKIEAAETGACGGKGSGTAAVGACGCRPPGEQKHAAQAVAAQLGSSAAPAAQQQQKVKTSKVATGAAAGGTTEAEGGSCR